MNKLCAITTLTLTTTLFHNKPNIQNAVLCIVALKLCLRSLNH